jgi:hypothetical protein
MQGQYRGEFEAAHLAIFGRRNFERNKNDSYSDGIVQQRWLLWQAARLMGRQKS